MCEFDFEFEAQLFVNPKIEKEEKRTPLFSGTFKGKSLIFNNYNAKYNIIFENYNQSGSSENIFFKL